MNTTVAMGLGMVAGAAGGTAIGAAAFENLDTPDLSTGKVVLSGASIMSAGTAAIGLMHLGSHLGPSSAIGSAAVGASLTGLIGLLMGGAALSELT
jgi:hypothetical protein